jgi:RNA polymerase-binding transcription factor DksA
MGNFNNDYYTCSACGKVISENDCHNYNGFCSECDSKGWHYCEDCGKPIEKSKFINNSIGLVCIECENKYKTK